MLKNLTGEKQCLPNVFVLKEVVQRNIFSQRKEQRATTNRNRKIVFNDNIIFLIKPQVRRNLKKSH